MDCLDGLIGIRGKCDTDSPDSLYYINDLPGMSIKEVDASMNSESTDAVSLIENKIEEAGNMLLSRLQTLFQPRFKGASLIENGVVGFAKDNLETISVQTGSLIGKQIEILGGDYLEVFISRIAIHSASTGNIDVLVYDLTQAKLLDTISVSCVANQIVYKDVYKKYKGNGQRLNLFICYAYTASYSTILSRNNCSSCTGHVYSNQYIRIANRSIPSASTKIQENLVSGSEDGLVLNYSVNCSMEPFICSIKHLLALAIRFKAGELLVMNMLYSKRNNSFINIYGQDHSELMAAYSAGYEAEVSNIFKNMKLPGNLCYTCNKRVRLETVI